MRVHRLSDFPLGWFVGNFDPSVIRHDSFELGIKAFGEGDHESCHYQLMSTELSLVLEGEIELAGVRLIAGDIAVMEPMEHGTFRSITDSRVLSMKFPSSPKDKVFCSEGHSQ